MKMLFVYYNVTCKFLLMDHVSFRWLKNDGFSFFDRIDQKFDIIYTIASSCLIDDSSTLTSEGRYWKSLLDLE
jgi:hypothetical protein